MDSWVVVTLVAIAMAVGLVGTVVPLVPGLGLVAGAAVCYGLVEGFGTIGWIAVAAIVVLFAAGTIAGLVLPGRAAGGAGAGRLSLLVGVIGAVIGFFVIPVIGVPVGGALGVYVAERAKTGNHPQAWRTTVATLKGFGLSALVQFAAGAAMVITWIAWVVVA